MITVDFKLIENLQSDTLYQLYLTILLLAWLKTKSLDIFFQK